MNFHVTLHGCWYSFIVHSSIDCDKCFLHVSTSPPFDLRTETDLVSERMCSFLECYTMAFFFFLWRSGTTRAMASSFVRFLDHTQRRTTVGRTPVDEWSVRRRDLYLTTHNRQISMPPVGFEPTISAGERPQTYALDGAATGIGCKMDLVRITVIPRRQNPVTMRN